jgi:hypothetical protein
MTCGTVDGHLSGCPAAVSVLSADNASADRPIHLILKNQ